MSVAGCTEIFNDSKSYTSINWFIDNWLLSLEYFDNYICMLSMNSEPFIDAMKIKLQFGIKGYKLFK